MFEKQLFTSGKFSLVATCVLSLASAQVDAAVLMLDFGGTLVTGSDRTNSPYHSVNGTFTDVTWNAQGQGNDTTLTWSDGTTATGVSLTTLKSASGGQTALSAAGWSSSVSATAVNTGIYAGTSVGRDGYMMTSTFTDNRSIGIQLSGLTAGEYDVYISGRNTNVTTAHTVNQYVAAGATAGSFNFAAYPSQSTTFAASATDKVSAWQFTAGNASASNYVKLSVTLSASNPYLNIATAGSSTNGLFNSIQVVAVPEPATLSSLGLAMLLLRRRRCR